jgi:hypothetical protein
MTATRKAGCYTDYWLLDELQVDDTDQRIVVHQGTKANGVTELRYYYTTATAALDCIASELLISLLKQLLTPQNNAPCTHRLHAAVTRPGRNPV